MTFSVTRQKHQVPPSPPFVIGYQRGALVPIVPLRTSTPFGSGFLDDLNTLPFHARLCGITLFFVIITTFITAFLATYRDHNQGYIAHN